MRVSTLALDEHNDVDMDASFVDGAVSPSSSPALSEPDSASSTTSGSSCSCVSTSQQTCQQEASFPHNTCACNKELTLYSHNVFFLPSIARMVTSGLEALSKDQLRASWICDKIISQSYDIVCLQEMFRNASTDVLTTRLKAAGYHVKARFNESMILTHSGLFFASRHPILYSDFYEFQHATFGTSDYFARKGVGCAVIDLGCEKTAAVFFTHTQAEEVGAPERQAQLQRCIVWICNKLKQLQRRGLISLQNTAVILAGDLNVNGKPLDDTDSRDDVTNDSFNSEFESMLHSMMRPHDLLTYSLGEDAAALVETSDDSRLDYIFSWKLCDGTGIGQNTTPAVQTPLVHPKQSAFASTSAAMAVAAALVWPISGPAASMIAAMSALTYLPKASWRSCEEEQLYSEAKAILAKTALLHVHKCDTETDWEVEPGHPVSDHHPVILRFSAHPCS